MTRSTSTILTVAAALVGAVLPVFLLSALAPAVKAELGFGDTALGVAIAAFFVAGAAMSIPAGRFADRRGAAVALRLGLAIAAAGNLAVAVVAHSRAVLMAAMFLSGLAVAFVDTGGARAIASSIAPGRQGVAFGGKEASIPTASFLAGVSVPVIGAQFGWRSAFGVGVVFCVLVMLAVSQRLEPDRPSRGGAARRLLPTRPFALTRSSPLEGAVPRADRDAEAERDTGIRRADAQSASTADTVDHGPWPLALLSVTGAFGGGAAASAASFLVASSVAMGRSPNVAGTVLALASATAVLTRLLVGVVADRRASAAVGIVAAMVFAGAVGTAALAVAARSTTGDGVALTVIVAGAVLAIGVGWGWTGLLFLAAVRLNPERPARAAGITLLGLGLGGALGPAVFGTLADQVGFPGAWSAATIALALATTTALAAQRLARHQARLVP